MPFAAAAAASAVVGAGASIYGASKQADAVNSASKSAARQQEEARIINAQNLQNTLGAVGPRLETAGDRANAAVTGGQAAGDAALNAGYGAAGQRLTQAGETATGYLNTGRETTGLGVQNANALLQPYIDTGNRALNMTGDLSGANGVEAGKAAMGNFQYSPAYQFNLEQGLRGVDASASAKGMLTSGSTMAGAMKYASGLASNEFTNYYARLSGLATQGLQASNTAGTNIMTGATNQAGFDRALAQNALGTGAGLAALDTGLAGGLSGNAMATANRLATNEQWTAGAISNLYTGTRRLRRRTRRARPTRRRSWRPRPARRWPISTATRRRASAARSTAA
jgi:hypothetical protein